MVGNLFADAFLLILVASAVLTREETWKQPHVTQCPPWIPLSWVNTVELKPSGNTTFTSRLCVSFFKLIKMCLNINFLRVCRICYFHHRYSEFEIYFVRKKNKKSISAKFINGFLRSMRVHSEGLAGTRFIPVNVVEGELPLMLFSFPLGSKSMWVLSRPRRHTGGISSSLLFPHTAPGWWREPFEGEKDSLDPLFPLSSWLLPELIVDPIKAGNTVYWLAKHMQ